MAPSVRHPHRFDRALGRTFLLLVRLVLLLLALVLLVLALRLLLAPRLSAEVARLQPQDCQKKTREVSTLAPGWVRGRARVRVWAARGGTRLLMNGSYTLMLELLLLSSSPMSFSR